MTSTNTQIEQTPVAPAAGFKRRFKVPDFLKIRRNRNQLTAANRRHIRHECRVVGTLSIANRSISLEGIISEVSKRGIKFRPAKTHLLDRKDVQVSIDFAGIHVVGKIAATRTDGYGIALFEDIEDADIETIVDMQSSVLESMSLDS